MRLNILSQIYQSLDEQAHHSPYSDQLEAFDAQYIRLWNMIYLNVFTLVMRKYHEDHA